MHNVLSNKPLSLQAHLLTIRSPQIAKSYKPGQFVMACIDDGYTKVPLTIADADAQEGLIKLIVLATSEGTQAIAALQPGDVVKNLSGPFGKPVQAALSGQVACIGGGVGTALVYPLAKSLAQAGNDVTTLIGARSKPYVILQEEFAEFSKVTVATEDGSMGKPGRVTEVLDEMLQDTSFRPKALYVAGPLAMMSRIVEKTQLSGIATIISLNPMTTDGSGTCGPCNVLVGGQVKSACLDGPYFDGRLVNFSDLASRRKTHEQQICHLAKTCCQT